MNASAEESATPDIDRARLPEGTALLEKLGRGRVVVGDFPVREADRDAHLRTAEALAGSVDLALIGEPISVVRQFPPAYRTRLLRDQGLAVWTSLNCRDRNRVALEGELVALADVGASAVHAITGGHPARGRRPDAMPVFDISAMELTTLAAQTPLVVSAAEAPEEPPAETRAARFAEKARRGADIAFLNLTSSPEVVDDFLRAVAELGQRRPAVVCVPFIIDEDTASVLTSLHASTMPAGYVERILAASDTLTAGIRAFVELATAYLDVPGVAGVCLSGGGAPGRQLDYARAMATAARELGAGL
ncbi:methylenetetrahydrofolate reductase [Microbacterium sp. SORGH_AS_0888]|uniref:methylenetetrahydrofolate reductase n=1 Tax=Microbacterium sp. SORGH_AS_0888 TaxID=3041791 RepID=UPI002787D378|nr:methylenetetrahydrofolate reductase [Microbacterium sp. SORGH_AS_0888]MDQ1131276.1 5,10-methylenetetrahydrofolate reductase [Microbacterium sp. SORGH_AS_0888]